jgi:prephenate dehydrogenase
MTRLALSSWEIWKDILATNGDFIAEALGEYQSGLRLTALHLDQNQLEQTFREGADFAARLRQK